MFDNPVQITVAQPSAITDSASSAVDVTTTGVVAIAANVNRKGLTMWNGTNVDLLIDFDRNPDNGTFAGILKPGGQFVLDSGRNGVPTFKIHAMAVTTPTSGKLHVRELT